MYFPILALIYLLIPCTFANGCHQGKDNIGCPTAIGTDVFTTAIADFCNNHFLVPNSLPTTVSINVGNSWPGLIYSLTIYEDEFGTDVSLWANFRVDRTSNGDPYVLDYALCISLLGQASIGNHTESNYGDDCAYSQGSSFGGWGNTDFGTVFAEPICPPGKGCLPWNIRPLGC
ncbi:hypothetical protein HO173_011243 [Letharia columbiana]|uniref:Uncharacterized protein n=1 Tax=Letharia columbiana TaxID=112416 RepID=A0A8H6KZE1_9LECA|nr:uncharacterized protein HO173_011243 [Letharia columbiana]KAF6229813.1 hypothetical protein HO173_011243 [Letharia columbiana]